MNVMFDVPSRNDVQKIIITEGTVLKKEQVTAGDFVTDWGKKMYSLISEEFERTREPDLMGLGASLSPDEMARLAAVITRSGSYVRTREQFTELIASLRAENRKQALSSENLAQMDDESLKALIEKLGNEKK